MQTRALTLARTQTHTDMGIRDREILGELSWAFTEVDVSDAAALVEFWRILSEKNCARCCDISNIRPIWPPLTKVFQCGCEHI